MSSEPTMHSTLTNLMEYSTPHQVSGNQQHGYSGDGRPRGTSGGESDSDDDALLFLAVPAGWLVRLLAFLGELVASAILGLVFPVAALVGALRALPAAAASSLRRVARGLLAAACTFAALVAALLVSVLLGFVLVRRCVEGPVTVRQQLFFDYTEAQPSAAVLLGGARGAVLPAGHSVSVSMALLLPDSYHNREVGMFQIKAEAVSASGVTMASATQPHMLRYKSGPVRLAQTALLCVPLTLGMRSEAQAASLRVLQYREGHGRHRRTGAIRVLLQPRAATVSLPQVYRAEVVVQTALPWAKSLARGFRWTLCVWVSSSVYAVLAVCWVRPLVLSARRRPSGVQEADGNLASGLGLVDMGDRPRKEASDCLAARWRARRSERKAQLRTRLHGGGMELEATEDSASSVAVVEREKEPGEAVNDP
ncbi:putative 2-carboxy-D-arabinitol-1-phosphatase [Zea mays]|uniref:Putative 2-carboxy-D-arabinitol-1-phosphatase n=2 Tax=Zea mays TaxID=4577 RepID=A0A1D6QHN1_MAIZE|nr:putative 2-carboxy-D-arabinitol-1-phosphatase [Zea mays]